MYSYPQDYKTPSGELTAVNIFFYFREELKDILIDTEAHMFNDAEVALTVNNEELGNSVCLDFREQTYRAVVSLKVSLGMLNNTDDQR